MFIQKKISPIALALLSLLPVAAMASTQVLSTYKNAPNPTILANIGVPGSSQMAEQALAMQIAVQAAAMQQSNPAMVGAVITGDTASVPYNGYQTSSLKAGFGYQQPANGSVLFADLIHVLPTTSGSTAGGAATTPQQGSSGSYYSATTAQAVVTSLGTGGSTSMPNGMKVSSNTTTTRSSGSPGPGSGPGIFSGSPGTASPGVTTTTYSISFGSAKTLQNGQTIAPATLSGLTASQAVTILQGGSAAAQAVVTALGTGGSTSMLPNGMEVSANTPQTMPTQPSGPFGKGGNTTGGTTGGTTTYSISFGSAKTTLSGLTASQAVAILSTSIQGVGSVS